MHRAKTRSSRQWQAERFTWLSQTPPAAEVRKNSWPRFRRSFGTKEFLLLVGVAAFPEVRLDLMATLDRKLHPRDSASEQRFRLLTLGRMVWLKESIIPDWLRHDLMGALPRPEMRSVREAWMVLLADKPRPGKPVRHWRSISPRVPRRRARSATACFSASCAASMTSRRRCAGETRSAVARA